MTPTAREALRELEDQVSALPVIDIAAATRTRWGAACISRELVIALITAARSALQSTPDERENAGLLKIGALALEARRKELDYSAPDHLSQYFMMQSALRRATDAAIAVQPDTTKGE